MSDRTAATNTMPAVGDLNSTARGTGARFNGGKPPMDYVPLHLLEGAARVFHKVTTREVNPYKKWNWLKGMAWSVPIGCIIRHLGKLMVGQDRDSDTGELHIDHIICNCLMLVHYYQCFPEGDDRPARKLFDIPFVPPPPPAGELRIGWTEIGRFVALDAADEERRREREAMREPAFVLLPDEDPTTRTIAELNNADLVASFTPPETGGYSTSGRQPQTDTPSDYGSDDWSKNNG